MPYTVNKTDPAASPNKYEVQDSILNTQTNISFVGKGYAGYGEVIAENFLHLLENFSSPTAPTKPVKGQLWFDSSSGKLKLYTGTSFQPAGGATYQATAPAALTAGDLWIDSSTQQLYFNNGATNILVGPPSTSGILSGFTYETIQDSFDNNQNITNWYNDGSRLAIISEDAFTPKITITGFSSINKGINLSNAITDLKLHGTATNADSLGNVLAENYLRSNISDTTTGTLAVANDGGLSVGADNDLKLQVDGTGVIIQNIVLDSNITFKINDGGTSTTVMTMVGSNGRIGIGLSTPATKLDVLGTIKATEFSGPVTGDVTADIVTINSSGNIVFQGSSYNTTLSLEDPSATRTLTLPNNSGAILTTGSTNTITSSLFSTTVTLQILNSSGVVLKTMYSPST